MRWQDHRVEATSGRRPGARRAQSRDGDVARAHAQAEAALRFRRGSTGDLLPVRPREADFVERVEDRGGRLWQRPDEEIALHTSLLYGSPNDWSQIGHRFAGTSRDRQGASGTGATSLQDHEGIARDGEGPKGTQLVRLLTARFTVRIRAPEPISSSKPKLPPPSGGTKHGQ